jgi:hypothetical protein
MDFDMGEDVAAVRSELRQLVDDHVPPDYFGAFTDDPADLAVAQSFCRTLVQTWAPLRGLARGVGRSGGIPVVPDSGARGDVGAS